MGKNLSVWQMNGRAFCCRNNIADLKRHCPNWILPTSPARVFALDDEILRTAIQFWLKENEWTWPSANCAR